MTHSVNLSKGGNVDLTKTNPGLTAVVVGLGWDPRTTDGVKFDLDASVVLCDASGKAPDGAHFVFYNNLVDPSGAVAHQGDNQTGDGDGDDEMVFVDFAKVPATIDKMVFIVSIDSAAERGQNFGQVGGAYIRVLNANDGAEIAKYDLQEDASANTSLIFGEVYRNGAEWKFRAVGEGYVNGLAGVISAFGLNG